MECLELSVWAGFGFGSASFSFFTFHYRDANLRPTEKVHFAPPRLSGSNFQTLNFQTLNHQQQATSNKQRVCVLRDSPNFVRNLTKSKMPVVKTTLVLVNIVLVKISSRT